MLVRRNRQYRSPGVGVSLLGSRISKEANVLSVERTKKRVLGDVVTEVRS